MIPQAKLSMAYKAALILGMVAVCWASVAWTANAQPARYLSEIIGASQGAVLGLLAGGTLSTVAALLLFNREFNSKDPEDQRFIVKFLLIGIGLGVAAGATWGVASTGHSGNTLMAFLGAVVGEAIWFALVVGTRDLLTVRYDDLGTGLGVVTAGLVMPIVGAVVGYHLWGQDNSSKQDNPSKQENR